MRISLQKMCMDTDNIITFGSFYIQIGTRAINRNSLYLYPDD
jgi:hypothetical protein